MVCTSSCSYSLLILSDVGIRLSLRSSTPDDESFLNLSKESLSSSSILSSIKPPSFSQSLSNKSWSSSIESSESNSDMKVLAA